MPTVDFSKEKDKEKKQMEVPKGANLRWAMQKHGVDVYSGLAKRFNCGGKGTCGTCRVHVKEGMENCSEPTTIERLRTALSLYAIGHEDEVRLSCQTRVLGDIKIEERPDFNLHGEDRKIATTRAGNIDEIP